MLAAVWRGGDGKATYAALLAVGTPVLDDNARAVDDLAGVALTVENTETGPLAELLAVGNLDEGDLVLVAESNDEFLVRLLLAGLVKDAHVGLAAVEGLGSLAETARKTVVHEGELEDTLEGVKDRHLALGGSGIGRNLNLLGNLDLGVLFYVRLERPHELASWSMMPWAAGSARNGGSGSRRRHRRSRGWC